MRHKGTVWSFNKVRCFGFIDLRSIPKLSRAFFTLESLVDKTLSIEVGMEVSFELDSTPNGGLIALKIQSAQ